MTIYRPAKFIIVTGLGNRHFYWSSIVKKVYKLAKHVSVMGSVWLRP